MRQLLVLTLWWALGGTPAWAGAWLREHETGFVAIGATALRHDTGESYVAKIYADYGVRPRLTLGIDAQEEPWSKGHILFFGRIPLFGMQRDTRVAFELGVGGYHDQAEWYPMHKIALAVGHGFTTRWGNGWAGADLAMEDRHGLDEPIYKLDAAIGLSSGWRARPLLKLETYMQSGQDAGWTLTPAVMFDMPSVGTWVLGVEHQSTDQTRTGLTLSLWRRF